MRAITVMYDSLNRKYLPNYGDNLSIMPNFRRLAKKTVTFDNFYVGSLPCIPARRELHTGRYNFLHRCWGPLEPFDDSIASILGKNGIYTHCVTDHAHYWQEGGSTYHTKFASCEMIRGQEGDFWKGEVKGFKENIDLHRQDEINRKYMQGENHPHVKTCQAGLEFLESNYQEDNWYLHIEYFDPHEPYFVPDKYKKMYTDKEQPFDWPFYGEVNEGSEEVSEARTNYRAVLSMIDEHFGKILDFMDEHDMWKDTMVIVNTDHGFLLSEHGEWAKCHCPFYNEVARIPLFIWNPQTGRKGIHTSSLVQTIDLPATILRQFEIDIPQQMEGIPLQGVLEHDEKIRDVALFGLFGGQLNATDGRYVYMKSPVDWDELIYQYTLMPMRHGGKRGFIQDEELKGIELYRECTFTRGLPVMKIPCRKLPAQGRYPTMLFDLEKDPKQEHPIRNQEQEKRIEQWMKKRMEQNDCPVEIYKRYGLN